MPASTQNRKPDPDGQEPPRMLEVVAEPEEQHNLIVEQWLGAPSFPAVRLGDDVYLAVRSLCQYFGVRSANQIDSLQRHKLLNRYIRKFHMATRGGLQTAWCIRLKAVAMWVVYLDLAEVRPELQQGLLEWDETLLEISASVFASKTPSALVSALQQYVPEITSEEQLHAFMEEVRTMRQQYDTLFRTLGTRLSNLERKVITPNQHYPVEEGDE
jgi:hypothetical protein